MTAPQTAASPALYSGPFNTAQTLGIDRGNYIAIHADIKFGRSTIITREESKHSVALATSPST